MDNVIPLDARDLKMRTQEEIFNHPNNFKRPINFMNYSTYDFDLINGQSTVHNQPFMNKRIDYSQHKNEIKI